MPLRSIVLVLFLSAGLLPAHHAFCASVPERPIASAAISSPGTRARQILHEILAQQESWKMIHAAEALIAIGEGPAVQASFAANQPAADQSDYRIGAWRVRARTAESLEERSRWIERVESVLIDPASADRLDAIETLSKLNRPVSDQTLAVARRLASDLSESDATFALWALAFAGDAGALERLTAVLTSTNSQARGRAAYALRWLRPASPLILRMLAQAADVEPSDTDAFVYVVSSALACQADPLRLQTWHSSLEKVLFQGEPAAQYEACQSLMTRYGIGDIPRLLPLLDAPESDTKTGVAWTILFIEARTRDHLGAAFAK